jgi:drug/metabolite transporter (DMT)-like permease
MQISHSRFFFAFILIFIFFLKTKSKIIKPNYKIHLSRSFCGWIGITILFGASSVIPVSDATALIFINPIFTMIFAILFLGEKVKFTKWLAVSFTFIGAIILIRPENNLLEIQLINIVLVLGALALGLETIFIKILTKYENPKQILLINNGIGLMISSIPVYFIWISPNIKQILALFFVGALMLCAQICFIQAMKRSEAHFVAPFFYFTLIFVCIYDFYIFQILPDKISIIGTTLIIVGGIILYVSQTRSKLS